MNIINVLLTNHAELIKDIVEILRSTSPAAADPSSRSCCYLPGFVILRSLSTNSTEFCSSLGEWEILPVLEKALFIPEPPALIAHRELGKYFEDKFKDFDPQTQNYLEFRKKAEEEFVVSASSYQSRNTRRQILKNAVYPVWIEGKCESSDSEAKVMRTEALQLLGYFAAYSKDKIIENKNLCELVIRNAFEPSAPLAQDAAVTVLVGILPTHPTIDYIIDINDKKS